MLETELFFSTSFLSLILSLAQAVIQPSMSSAFTSILVPLRNANPMLMTCTGAVSGLSSPRLPNQGMGTGNAISGGRLRPPATSVRPFAKVTTAERGVLRTTAGLPSLGRYMDSDSSRPEHPESKMA